MIPYLPLCAFGGGGGGGGGGVGGLHSTVGNSEAHCGALWFVRWRQSTLSACQRVIPSCNCRWPHHHPIVLTGSLELVSAPSANNLFFMLSPCPIVQPEPLKNS